MENFTNEHSNERLNLNGSDWTLSGWYPNQWQFAISMELGTQFPPLVAPIPAAVPGAVQSDLAAAGWLEDYNLGTKSLHGEWVNQKDWVYEKKFSVPDGWVRDRCELIFDGLDYSGEIYLNRKLIAQFEGMFKPVTIDVTELLKEAQDGENVLQVYLEPSPQVQGQVGYSSRVDKLKSRFNYGWDWCPRIVPVGIWRDVCLKTFSGLKITDLYPKADLLEDFRTGVVEVQVEAEVLRKGWYSFEYVLEDHDGQVICKENVKVQLNGGKRTVCQRLRPGIVNVWWPNGYGEQPLYRMSVLILDEHSSRCDQQTRQFGFRRAVFVQNEGSPEGALPYTLIMNGTRIFLRGVNWTTITPLYGSVTAEQYAQYLGRFQAMNSNMLRINGVGIIEKRDFYEVCDRIGLMVWQDFPQSSSGINNTPPDDPDFLKELEEVAVFAVKEKRNHPSLVLWCGGNELTWENLTPVTEFHANIRMLKRVVNQLDPSRHFLPTTASGPKFNAAEEDFGKGLHHDVHGPWNYIGEGEHYRYYNGEDALFRSEAGSPGALRPEMIRKWADGYKAWPPKSSNPYWVFKGAWWIQWDQLGALFGPFHEDNNELDLFCHLSRYLQKESIRYAAEATRRKEPKSSGFLVWGGNEPYANTSNCSLIEYDGMPKPAFYALQRAFANLHVSARYHKLSYKAGEIFTSDIFVHEENLSSRTNNGIPRSLRARAQIVDITGKIIHESVFAGVGGELNRYVGTVEWQAAETEHRLFILRVNLETADHHAKSSQPLCGNTYVFTVNSDYPLAPLRNAPRAAIELAAGDQPGAVVVVNPSAITAFGVLVQEREPERFINYDHNDFILLPGEQVQIICSDRLISVDELIVSGINI